MRLNIEKSSVMWFRPRSLVNSPLEDIVDGTCLNTVKTQKYLGITFDDSLQWVHHTSAICKQLSFYLFWINSHRRDLPNAVIKMLVDSLVLSRINYALPAWKFDHVSAHRTRLHWLPVTSMIKHRSLCAIYRHYSDPNCMLLDPPFIFGSQHCYHTRTAKHFVHLNRCRLSATQRSFWHAVAKWWNDLSGGIVTSSTFLSDIYNHF